MCWLAWCAVLGMLYLFENNTASRILLIWSLLLPLLDALMMTIAVRHLRFVVELADQAEKSGDIPIGIRIDCAVPMVRFRIMIQSENRLTDETAQHVSWARQGTHSCLMQTAHCGLLIIRLKLSVSGMLGLFERTAGEEYRGTVWAPPTLQPVQIILREDGAFHAGSAVENRRPWQGISDSFTVREYVPGDPVRMVHWKLSEKMDTMMIREEEYAGSGQLLLAADLSAAEDGKGVSDMTEVLFSLSHALLENGIPHGVLWQPSSAAQPELRRIETPMDQAAFETDYFTALPHRSLPLAAGEAAQQYSHAILIGNASFAQEFGGQTTSICGRADLHDVIMI